MSRLPGAAKDFEAVLLRRGFDKGAIQYGMRQIFGDDWREINTSRLLNRLRMKGVALTPSLPDCVDELEVLIRGTIGLRDNRALQRK